MSKYGSRIGPGEVYREIHIRTLSGENYQLVKGESLLMSTDSTLVLTKGGNEYCIPNVQIQRIDLYKVGGKTKVNQFK